MELKYSRRVFLGGAASFALWPDNLWGEEAEPKPSESSLIWENSDRSATDSVMARRLYLDLAGRIPSAGEARDYVGCKNPEKKNILVDRLLASEDFANYWAMRWCDVLRVKSEFPINLWPNAVYVYYSRIRSFVQSGETWEHFARSLIMSQGSNFRDAEVNFYRATDRRDADGWAEAVAQTFLGIAPKDLDDVRRKQLASYFRNLRIKKTREWKEEIVFVEGADLRPKLCGELFGERRAAVAAAFFRRLKEWIFGPAAGSFADIPMRSDNLKDALKEIVLSPEYALGSVTGGFPARRLDAEILDDVFCSLSGSKRNYQSAAPEPFSFLPKDRSSVCIEDGSITSGFLSLFARPARDTGLMDERGSDVSTKQRLYLFNSADIHRKLGKAFMPPWKKADGSVDPWYRLAQEKRIEEVYWQIFSRAPSDEELKIIDGLWQRRRGDGKKAKASFGELLRDVAWCLINTKEFIYRV